MFPYRTNIEGKWVSPIAIGRAGTWLYTWFEQAMWHCGLATFEQQWKIPSVRVGTPGSWNSYRPNVSTV